MKANSVTLFEKQLYHSYSIAIEDLLKANFHHGLSAIIVWLERLLQQKILSEKSVFDFDVDTKEVPDLQNLLEDGDKFYLKLFRERNYITEENRENKSITPLADCIRRLYNSLFNEDRDNDNKLTVYDGLRNLLESLLGERIAHDSKLQSFEKWMRLEDELETHHTLWSSWMNNIPRESIEKEKGKIMSLAENSKLFEMADLRRFGKNKEQEANNYLAHVEEYKNASPVTYIQRSTHDSDIISFKDEIRLRLRLLQKLDIVDWVFLVDLLRYPVLQDHAVLFISELNEFFLIIQTIMTKEVNTPKIHLLIITLNNYFEFINRTLLDLSGLSKERENHSGDIGDANQISELTKAEYEKWITELIPSSFRQMLDCIFPHAELSQSKYFLPFFEWINTHGKLYINHERVPSKVELINLLNELFEERLVKQPSDKHFLIEHLQPEQISWNALAKLVLLLREDESDIIFREKLLTHYLSYFGRENFQWHESDEVNFNALLNDAYYFSLVFSSYSNPTEKWNEVYKKFKVNYEGWLITGSGYVNYHRESYLLAAGAGIAYFDYQKGYTERANKFINSLCSIILKQLRVSNKSNLEYYLTPLKFAVIAVGKYSKEMTDPVVFQLLTSLDSLKAVLLLFGELSNHADGSALSEQVKDMLRERIDGEFWIIDNPYADTDFKGEIDHLKRIKKRLLENFL